VPETYPWEGRGWPGKEQKRDFSAGENFHVWIVVGVCDCIFVITHQTVQKGNFIICQLHFNKPDFKKKEISRPHPLKKKPIAS
jgi:hypothetical protein